MKESSRISWTPSAPRASRTSQALIRSESHLDYGILISPKRQMIPKVGNPNSFLCQNFH